MGHHSQRNLPFLSLYFGAKKDGMTSDDEIKTQLRSLSTRYYDQTNILNGLNMSYQQEKRNWIIEKEHLMKKIDMMNKISDIEPSKRKSYEDSNIISKLALEFKALSSKVENELLVVKKEFSKTEESLTEKIEIMKRENTALRNAMMEVINEDSSDNSSNACTDYLVASTDICEKQPEADDQLSDGCSCQCCHKLIGQKKLLMNIVSSQKQRLLEKNAKIKALKSVINTPFLSENEKASCLSRT